MNFQWSNFTDDSDACAIDVDNVSTIEVTLDLPDNTIDWLPYHYTKYLPTWHLVRSYD